MSYLPGEEPELIEDLIKRKEFYWNKRWNYEKSPINDFVPRFLLEDALNQGVMLKPLNYQRFIETLFNPNTPYKRMLLLWDTGMGKTIGALLSAMRFIKNFRLEFESGNQEIGSVFIIGFSEKVFKNDLLRFPEFGFVSSEERAYLDRLKKAAVSNGASKNDVDAYHEFSSKIRRRLTNRKGNGFFKFYGYKAFVNRIFVPEPGVDLNTMNEGQIQKALADKKIRYDETLLAEFKNSLIICDEIHNVYNSLEKNNWGIAVQAVLDREPTCRGIFMSATPINNSPTEIVDILNLLLPRDQRQNKDTFFKTDKELKPDALARIAELCRGRVSFLKDVNPKHFPRVNMIGRSVAGIDYLKFVRCTMSPFHYATYKAVYHGALAQDSQYIVDFALPNPESNKIGIYQTQQIKKILAQAPQKWKNAHDIDYIDGRIVGAVCRRENLKKYSSKYAQLIDIMQKIVEKRGGKTIIYHDSVINSGILFIAEVLKQNGFVDEFGTANDNTLCVICGKEKKAHKAAGTKLGSGESRTGESRTGESRTGESRTGDDVDDSESVNQNADDFNDTASESSTASTGRPDEEKKAAFNYINEDADELEKIRALDKQIFRLAATHELHDETPFIQTEEDLYQSVYVKEDDHANTNKDLADDDDLSDDEKSESDGDDELADDDHVYGFDDLNPPSGNNSAWSVYRDQIGNYVIYGDKEVQFRAHKRSKKSGGIYYFIDPNHKSHAQKISEEFEKSLTHILKEADVIVKTFNSDKILIHWLVEHEFTILRQDLKHTYFVRKHDVRGGAIYGGHDRNANDIFYGGAARPQTIAHHEFRAARFILAHSDIDKHALDYSIEKFNHMDNLWGHNYLILVGSRIIKESYDIKAIQNSIVAGRPANIPTLLQFLGRAVRKNSHKGLPHDRRVVNFMILTSALPNGKLSYEEIKYKEKIEVFKTIQKIEKVFHENAVDSLINYDTIKKSLDQASMSLSALPYEPNVDKRLMRQFKPSELNDTTFKIYYAQEEVNIIKVIIKRLFIEISPVWEYKDLFAACKNPRYKHPNEPETLVDYEHEINTSLFAEENFTIALHQLIWNANTKYVEPSLTKIKNFNLGDRLNDPTDKIILLVGDQNSVILSYNSFYILVPLDTAINAPIIDVELPYRISRREEHSSINMDAFIQNKRIDFDYDDKKKIFIRKWEGISIENMENVVCEYGTTFHVKFLEECIEYVFNAWTDPKTERSDNHDFYFKMLYYYDLLNLVMWAYTCKPRLFEQYARYAVPVRAKDIKLKALEAYERNKEMEDIAIKQRKDRRREKRGRSASRGRSAVSKSDPKLGPRGRSASKDREKPAEQKPCGSACGKSCGKSCGKPMRASKIIAPSKPIYDETDISPPDNSDLGTSGVINLLKTSINRSSNVWIPQEFRENYYKILKQSEMLFIGRKKKNKMINKIEALYLPIGHYIHKFPRVYHPDKNWYEDPVYTQPDRAYKENNLLIGYDEKSKTGVHVRFKIRNPIHNIKKFKDIRMIEKGSICKSKNKIELKRVAIKLSINVNDKINVEELCSLIRTRLIRMELKERIAKSDIKYFYFHYESRPDTITAI